MASRAEMASEAAALGDLLAAVLTDLDAFRAAKGEPSKATEKTVMATEEAEEAIDHEGSPKRKEHAPSRKSGAHKRARSASEYTTKSETRREAVPLLLLDPSDVKGRKGRVQGGEDDEGDWRRRKVPRLGAHTAWLLSPGLTADEKRLALPLLFNERLPYEPETDAPAFEALERSVHAQRPRLDAVFQSEGLTPSVTSARRVRVEPSGKHGPFLTFVSAKLLPFSLEVIAETLQKLIHQAALPLHATDETPPSVVFAKQQYYLRPDAASDGTGVPLLLRCVFQQTTENDRVLGVWSGTGEWPDEMAGAHEASAPIREQGWVLIQRCPVATSSGRERSSPPTSTQTRCLVQSCLHVMPGLSHGAIRSDKSYLDVLSTVTAPSYQKLIDEREQVLENRFMDRMLQIRARQQQCVRPPGYSRSSSL